VLRGARVVDDRVSSYCCDEHDEGDGRPKEAAHSHSTHFRIARDGGKTAGLGAAVAWNSLPRQAAIGTSPAGLCRIVSRNLESIVQRSELSSADAAERSSEQRIA
jgi:hypothetical protein